MEMEYVISITSLVAVRGFGTYTVGIVARNITIPTTPVARSDVVFPLCQNAGISQHMAGPVLKAHVRPKDLKIDGA